MPKMRYFYGKSCKNRSVLVDLPTDLCRLGALYFQTFTLLLLYTIKGVQY